MFNLAPESKRPLHLAQNMPIQTQAARVAVNQSEARYKTGLGSIAQVAEANQTLANSRVQEAMAKVGVWRALLAVASVHGDIKPFLSENRPRSKRYVKMGLIRLAMGRPVTIIVIVSAFVLFSVVAMTRMKVDIFPQINLPRVTVIQPYGGMDPAQMEGYMVTFYEQHFFYISGVDHVASKNHPGRVGHGCIFQT